MHTPPNIVLITCHDLGRHLGCYGVPDVSTPVLDALAGEGMLFEQYYATASQSSPCRGSVMTGRYPHSNGLLGLVNHGWELSDDYPTLAQLLGERGYHTALFGIQHEKSSWERMGYRECAPPFMSERICSNFNLWLWQREKTTPFFASLGFFEAHRPFTGPQFKSGDPAAVQPPPYLPGRPEVRQDLADMHGMIAAVDLAVERILASLHDTGHAENTLVILTTDHGIAFPYAKSTLYDAGIGTVLLMRWPAGMPAGQRIPQLLSSVDLLPTLLDLVGAPPIATAQGRAFTPLLYDQSYQERAAIYAEKTWHDHYDPVRAMRTQRWKFIQNFPDDVGAPSTFRPRIVLPSDVENSLSRQALHLLGDPHMYPRPEEELYDLEQDPYEQQNLAADAAHGGTLAEMRYHLMQWMEETADPLLRGPIPSPAPPKILR